MPTIAYITHPTCLLHEMGPHHPERPDRIRAIEAQLKHDGIWDKLSRHEAPLVDESHLLRVHTPAYLQRIKTASPRSGHAWLDPDTAMNPHTLEAALRAAGALVLAADLVAQKTVAAAFCNIRPPGHHAEHNRAMGFCFFNNVAVGAAYVLDILGFQRVAIFDFDVHHGNGTEDIFKNDSRVMLCSSYQHPYYPYSQPGRAGSNPHIIKTPLDAGADGSDLQRAFKKDWLAAVEDFGPEWVFVSAGFDAHADDNMSGLRFADEDYAWISERIVDIARTFAQGRIISALEGGYELSSLGRSASRHVQALMSQRE